MLEKLNPANGLPWRSPWRIWVALALALAASPAAAAPQSNPCTQSSQTAAECDPVNSGNPLPVTSTVPAAGTAGAGYPAGATAITGNATGTTGAVVGTLAAASGKFTYICGFNITAAGGTATVGPVTVAGLIGSSQVYGLPVNATASQVLITQNFFPCIQSSAVNTAITVTTTADGTASAVDVNSWGFQE